MSLVMFVTAAITAALQTPEQALDLSAVNAQRAWFFADRYGSNS